jgi:hypothetical protein
MYDRCLETVLLRLDRRAEYELNSTESNPFPEREKYH